MEIYWNKNTVDIVCENVIVAYVVPDEKYALLTPIKTAKIIQPLMKYNEIVEQLNKQQNLNLKEVQNYCIIILSPVGALFEHSNIKEIIGGKYIQDNKKVFDDFFISFREKICLLTNHLDNDVVDRRIAIKLLWKYFCNGKIEEYYNSKLIREEITEIKYKMISFFDSTVIKVSNHLFLWEKAFGRKSVYKMIQNKFANNCLEKEYFSEPIYISQRSCDDIFLKISERKKLISEANVHKIEEQILKDCNEILGILHNESLSCQYFYKSSDKNAKQKVYSMCELYKIYALILKECDNKKLKKEIIDNIFSNPTDYNYQMIEKSFQETHIAVELVLLNIISINNIAIGNENNDKNINWYEVADKLHCTVLPYTYVYLHLYPEESINVFVNKALGVDLEEISNAKEKYYIQMVYDKFYDYDEINARIPNELGGRYLCVSKYYTNKSSFVDKDTKRDKIKNRADGVSKKYWRKRIFRKENFSKNKNQKANEVKKRISKYAKFFKLQNSVIVKNISKEL